MYIDNEETTSGFTHNTLVTFKQHINKKKIYRLWVKNISQLSMHFDSNDNKK